MDMSYVKFIACNSARNESCDWLVSFCLHVPEALLTTQLTLIAPPHLGGAETAASEIGKRY
jgi:hypothetical protein